MIRKKNLIKELAYERLRKIILKTKLEMVYYMSHSMKFFECNIYHLSIHIHIDICAYIFINDEYYTQYIHLI